MEHGKAIVGVADFDSYNILGAIPDSNEAKIDSKLGLWGNT
ncbi:MAG: hypothetical protein ABIO93_32865 [Dyadobacter sp.]